QPSIRIHGRCLVRTERAIRIAVAATGIAGIVALAPTAAAASPATGRPASATTVLNSPDGFVIWRGEGIRIRKCPSTSCTVLGLGYSSHHAGWYCGEESGGFAHIRDFTTGVDGWVSSSWIYYGCD